MSPEFPKEELQKQLLKTSMMSPDFWGRMVSWGLKKTSRLFFITSATAWRIY
jgi:hypothetical protein